MEKYPVEELKGELFLWSETGTEGGYWAFRDKRYIFPPTKDWPHERWSYDGLHVLEDGDILTIYSKEDPAKVIWTGTIKLKPHQLFTEHASGMWIHADQEDIDRESWAEWFLEGYPASLVPYQKINASN